MHCHRHVAAAPGLLAKPDHRRIPLPAEAPSPELRLGRAPESVVCGQFPPRRAGAQDLEESLQVQRHDFRSATFSPGPPSLHYRMNEALSRRAIWRLQVSLLNMALSSLPLRLRPCQKAFVLQRRRLISNIWGVYFCLGKMAG